MFYLEIILSFLLNSFKLLFHSFICYLIDTVWLVLFFLQFFGYGFCWSLFPGDEDVAMFEGGTWSSGLWPLSSPSPDPSRDSSPDITVDHSCL